MSTLLNNVTVWPAVLGLCLIVLRAHWGAWLFLPAAIRFVLWPTLLLFAPFLPLWLLLLVLPLIPVFLMIFALRGGQAVLAGIFGRDVAARVTARAVISVLGAVFGGFGRIRERRPSDPILPRPQQPPFSPQRGPR